MWHSISSCVVPNKVLADAEKCSFRLPANDFCLAHKFFITTFFLEACLVYTWYEDIILVIIYQPTGLPQGSRLFYMLQQSFPHALIISACLQILKRELKEFLFS